jgi:hypothetical protein
MSIYWNKILLNHLRKTNNITDKYRLTIDPIGRIYFYFQKECKDESSEMSVKIIFFPKKKFPIK